MKTAFSTAALSGAAAATLQGLGLVRLKAFNVKDYGAFGDGASHPLSAQYGTLPLAQLVWPEATALSNEIDRLAATRALNAMPTTGGTLYFPQGTYMTDGVPLTRAINNVRIAGAGSSGSTIKWAAGIAPGTPASVTGNAIEITNVSGWKVEDLGFDGNASNNVTDNIGTHWHPVYSTGSDHCAVRRCKSVNTLANAIFFATGSYHAIENNWLDGGNLYNAAQTYMSEGGVRCFADHSKIRNNHVVNWWKEIFVAAADCAVEDNYCVHGTVVQPDANSLEVYAQANQSGLSRRCIVRNNTVENAWHQGIQIGGLSENSICEGNEVRSSWTMLPAAPAAPAAANVLTAGNVDAGTRFYAYTDVVNGVEGQLSAPSAAVTTDGTHQQVNLSAIVAGPAGTTARNVYSTKTTGTLNGPWFRLTTLADNTTTTYTANTADASLGAQLMQTSGGLADATGGNGINIVTSGCVCTDNQIDGFWRGIQVFQTVTEAITGDPLGARAALVAHNRIVNPVQQDSSAHCGIFVQNDDVIVADNYVEGTTIFATLAQRLSVRGNTVRNSLRSGIHVISCQDVKVNGNTVSGANTALTASGEHGIYIDNTDGTGRRASVVGNTVLGALGGAYGILLSYVSYGVLNANIVQGGASVGMALQTCDHITASGNTSEGNATYGWRDAAFGGVSDSITVIGNEFRNNTTAPVLRGTSTNMAYRSNGGYNPVGVLGPPAVPATTVAYTNAYGVDATVFIAGGTVTGIAIGGTATGLTSGAFRVPAGQTITLTYSVVPTWTWFGD